MRDLQLHTPHRDLPSSTRPLKSEHNKNPRKVIKRSLNPAFKHVSEDGSAPKEVSEEASDDENGENFIPPAKAVIPYSSEITSDKAQINNTEMEFFKTIESIESELVIKHLTEARIRVINSKDLGPSKNLLDALITVVINEFYGGLYNRKDWVDKLLLNKSNIVLMSFTILILILILFAILTSSIVNSDDNAFPMGPVPT